MMGELGKMITKFDQLNQEKIGVVNPSTKSKPRPKSQKRGKKI